MSTTAFGGARHAADQSLTSYDVVEHLSQSGSGPPIVLTVVGNEMEGLVPAQQDFINRAETRKAPLDVIRIEDAPHAFDVFATTAQAVIAARAAQLWETRSSHTRWGDQRSHL
ncbi:MAG: hypothetical protein L0H96_12790 [Humibacillus sp.]|nr:hypothetical protein [Humibacillus sp.]MDN5777782.1 hypothetical protein [Humibacillus sp.]